MPARGGAGLRGRAIGAVFAGDLITLFVYWELTAVSSVFLIWARPHARSLPGSGMRYLIIQVGSGVLLLAGPAGLLRRHRLARLSATSGSATWHGI